MAFTAPAAYSIGKSIRPSTTPQFNFPGPGTYSASDAWQSFKPGAFSRNTSRYGAHRPKIAPPRKSSDFSASLGPGSYNVSQKEYWSSPKFSIPKAKNYFEAIRAKTKTPGPSDYKSALTNTKANRFSFPKSPKFHNPKINNPGPGTYNPKNPLLNLEGKPVKFPVSPRLSLEENRKAPGPGAYNLKFEKLLKNGPAWTFEQSEKSRGKTASNPGPGSYNTKHTVGDAPHYLFYNIKKKIPGI